MMVDVLIFFAALRPRRLRHHICCKHCIEHQRQNVMEVPEVRCDICANRIHVMGPQPNEILSKRVNINVLWLPNFVWTPCFLKNFINASHRSRLSGLLTFTSLKWRHKAVNSRWFVFDTFSSHDINKRSLRIFLFLCRAIFSALRKRELTSIFDPPVTLVTFLVCLTFLAYPRIAPVPTIS